MAAMTRATVSIRELKSRLSHYLKLARSGETVVITDRGVPVGRLVAIEQDLDEQIAALRTARQLHWSGRRLGPRKPALRIPAGKSVAALLIEDRE
jgi:prevent-host-death family protein